MGQRDLPLASGSAHAKAFESAGWTLAKRRGNGKHYILTKAGETATLSIPDHKEVKRMLLQKQIRLAGLTEQQYLKFFHG